MALTRFGFHFSSTSYPEISSGALFGQILDVARAAEDSGFDSLWVPDHVHQNPIGGGPSGPMLEAYLLLAALAARTSTPLLGSVVSPVTFRLPSVFAKTIASLDVISGGRAVLGIGAGWDTAEHAAYGVPFPSTSERFERLEEALEITKVMLSGEPASYTGEHYAIEDAWNAPQPIQSQIPVLVGGGGERKTLRLAARFGDACNVFGEPEAIAHKLDVLRQHCEDVGRDYSEITTTCGIMPPDDPDEVVRLVAARHEVGIDGVILFGASAPSAATVAAWGAALHKAFD
jgi:F420-dependent oxidoreductase-like protein